MSEPNWVALGGGAVDYVGGWAAGTAYRSGDVVRHNGIEYLAVNPSTGQTPTPAAPLMTGTELAYAEITADLASTSVTTEATATTIITAPAVTVDGATAIFVEVFFPACTTSSSTASDVWLYDGAVSLGKIGVAVANASGIGSFFRAVRKLTPSAGSHTFSARISNVVAGAVVVRAGAGGTAQHMPAFIRISTVQPTAVAVRTFTAPGIGTTLPASPVDGDEYILVDSLTAPTYQWHFRYMASVTDAYKWVFVGGASLQVKDDTTQTSSSSAYVTLAGGPNITVPRAGIYVIENGCTGESLSQAYQFMSYDIGATVAVDADALLLTASASGTGQVSAMRSNQKTLAAGTTLTSKYRNHAGASCSWSKRWLRATPVRVA